MFFKNKIFSITAICMTICVATIAVVFAFSSASVTFNNTVGFDASKGVGATIGFSGTSTIPGHESIGMKVSDETVSSITIATDASSNSFTASIDDVDFTAKNQTITYVFTITNTNADKDFTVIETHAENTSDNYTITREFSSTDHILSASGTSHGSSLTITYTITLVNESGAGDFSPNIVISLS